MIDSKRQVFVDASGRRRRLLTVAGAVVGSTLAAGIAVLVAGVIGAVPLPLPGLPASGQDVQRDRRVPAAEPPSSAPAAGTGRTPTPASGVAPSARTTAPVGSAAPTSGPTAGTTTRGNRPTAHPGNPKPSRSR